MDGSSSRRRRPPIAGNAGFSISNPPLEGAEECISSVLQVDELVTIAVETMMAQGGPREITSRGRQRCYAIE